MLSTYAESIIEKIQALDKEEVEKLHVRVYENTYLIIVDNFILSSTIVKVELNKLRDNEDFISIKNAVHNLPCYSSTTDTTSYDYPKFIYLHIEDYLKDVINKPYLSKYYVNSIDNIKEENENELTFYFNNDISPITISFKTIKLTKDKITKFWKNHMHTINSDTNILIEEYLDTGPIYDLTDLLGIVFDIRQVSGYTVHSDTFIINTPSVIILNELSSISLTKLSNFLKLAMNKWVTESNKYLAENSAVEAKLQLITNSLSQWEATQSKALSDLDNRVTTLLNNYESQLTEATDKLEERAISLLTDSLYNLKQEASTKVQKSMVSITKDITELDSTIKNLHETLNKPIDLYED